MFSPLDLLSEYRLQHGVIGPLYVTSSYSTWIFCRGGGGGGGFRLCNWLSLRRLVSWINHLPPACWSSFWKSTFKQQLGCRFDIMDSVSSFFCILTYAIIYVLIHHIIFRLYLYFLNVVLYFFRYSSTNIFHRRSLYTFYYMHIMQYVWGMVTSRVLASANLLHLEHALFPAHTPF